MPHPTQRLDTGARSALFATTRRVIDRASVRAFSSTPAPQPGALPEREPRVAPTPGQSPAPAPAPVAMMVPSHAALTRFAPSSRPLSPAPHPQSMVRRRRSRGSASVVLRRIAPAATLDRYFGSADDEVHVTDGHWVHCRTAPEKRLISSAWSGRLWLSSGTPAPLPGCSDVARRRAA